MIRQHRSWSGLVLAEEFCMNFYKIDCHHLTLMSNSKPMQHSALYRIGFQLTTFQEIDNFAHYLQVYNPKENNYVISQTISVIRECKGEVFMSYRENETTAKVVGYNKANSTITKAIFEFPMTKNNAIYISISERYIAAVDKDSLNCIKLYNRLPRTTQPQRTTFASVFKNIAVKDSPFTTKRLPHFAVVYNILFLPDGALLATGHGSGKHRLCKYLIPVNPDLNPILAWSNDDLHLPFGLAVSKDGLIYTSSARRKTIYILSDQGM